jgi:hypothetical protein
MYTALVYFALAGVFGHAALTGGPVWLKDYPAARQQSVQANKPLAVFIGAGKQGWQEVSQDGRLDKDVLKILSADYVCVYVDVNQAAGKELAGEFEVAEGPGLIISNRQAKLQAFHHEGSLSNQDIERYLRRFAAPDVVVQYTETKPLNRTSYYQQAPQPAAPVNYAPYGNYTPPVFFSSGRC